ncbi:MAG: hypothetical protein SGJ19_14965 [Planctomycetia bacterium]|nr:hypothetical protein [Planctomycetia bacterium]
MLISQTLGRSLPARHRWLKAAQKKAAQNPAQQTRAGSGEESHVATATQQKTSVLPGFATSCDVLQSCSIPPAGVEHSPDSSQKTGIRVESGAESGALEARQSTIDHNLATVVEAWPRLPEAIKAGIVAMVRSAARP